MIWKKYSILLLFVALCSIPIFITFNRGINYFDEGYMLEGARRVISGELPYRDFHFIYTPITIYILAFFLRMGGHFIIVERFAAAIISIIGIIFLGLLSIKLTKNYILALFSMLLYSVWGPSHINFFWPVMCIIPFLFIYFYLFTNSYFLLSGVLLGTILLCKHNFGAALIVSLCCYYIIVRPSNKILLIIFGIFIPIILFTGYLLLTQSFLSFLSDMNTYTIQEVLFNKSLSVPFPSQSIGKLILYLFPAIVSIILGIGIYIKKIHMKLLIIPLSIFTFYLFGIFPTPDWTHLLPLLSTMGILYALLPNIFGNKYRFYCYILMIFVIGAGLYSLSFRNYYRWEAPLTKQVNCLSSGVMKYICIDEKNKTVINQTLAFVSRETKNDSYIFAFYNDPIYYFLSQKSNPTRYIDFNVNIEKKEEQNVISELKKKKVNVIVTRFSPTSSNSKFITKYIEKNYQQINRVYEFIVWRNRNLTLQP